MRIVFLVSERLGGRGGMESVLKNTAEELLQRGHRVRIILAAQSCNPEWERGLPITVFYDKHPDFRNSEEKISSGVQRLEYIFAEEPNPEFIICMSAFSIKIARAVKESLHMDARIVSWLHFSLHKEKYKEMLALADGHLCISAGILKQLQTATPGIPSGLIFNSVNVTQPIIARSTIPSFIYIGRMDNKQKRVDLIFRALSRVNGDWKLLLIGEGPDKHMLEELSYDLGISERLSWQGWQENPWSCVNEGTALVLSSDYEGFPMVLVEALSRGLAVVASNCLTGPEDIVTEGSNGWLFKPGDENQLASLLTGIADGTLQLPKASVCAESVQKFAAGEVVVRLEQFLKKLFLQSAPGNPYKLKA